MGKISFEDVEQYESKNSGPKGYKFFGLKNDGDSAIVRIWFILGINCDRLPNESIAAIKAAASVLQTSSRP